MTCEDKIRSDNKIEFCFSAQHSNYHLIDDHTYTTNEPFKVTISTGVLKKITLFYYLTNFYYLLTASKLGQ